MFPLRFTSIRPSSSIQIFSSNTYSSVPVGTTVTWKGAFFVTLSYTNETHRILSVNTSQDWLSYLSGAGIKIRPEG
jgi:hypothetical protein